MFCIPEKKMFDSSAPVCLTVLFPGQCPISAIFHYYFLFCNRLKVPDIFKTKGTQTQTDNTQSVASLMLRSFSKVPLIALYKRPQPKELASEVPVDTAFGGAQGLGTRIMFSISMHKYSF